MKPLCAIFLAFTLLLAACQTEAPPAPFDLTAAEDGATPTIGLGVIETVPTEPAGPTNTPIPVPTDTPDTPTPELPSPTPEGNGPLPAPGLFTLDWDERDPFVAGLIAAQQPILDGLPGASVYHIDMHFNDALNQITASEEIRYTNQEAVELNEVYFRLFPNLADGHTAIAAALVNDRPVAPSYELEDSAMRVPFFAPLAPGDSVVIRLEFTVDIPVEGGGNYGTFIYDNDILALAHFYPIIAVYDDEGWNLEIAPPSGDVVYSDTSFYLVRVDAPAGPAIVASGIEISRSAGDGRQTVTYAAGPMRDFYLAASSRYAVVSQQVGEYTVNTYAPTELGAPNERVLTFAREALLTFNEQVGPYPFAELDVVAIPTLALGVEYPGIVAIALSLYDGNNFPEVWLESTVVHEVGHQWFYSIVGNDQLDEPWLDESLTQYITYLYYLIRYGEGPAGTFRDSLVSRWENIDSANIPIGQPVAAYSGSEYNGIVYGRGPLFFETMADTIGAAAMADFLHSYYNQHMWGIATSESLRFAAEASCGCDLEALFVDWIYVP